MGLKDYSNIIIKELRVYQWSKNVIVFLPLIISHQFYNYSLIIKNLMGFIAFSLIASSIYIINDIKDLDNDKKHPIKHKRPLAAGDMSIGAAQIVCVFCLLIGLSISIYIDILFFYIIFIYIVLNLCYTFYFKNLLIIDVIFLTMFFTARLLSGHVVNLVYPSTWLISFSIYFFFSLSLLKRYIDIKVLEDSGNNYKEYILSDNIVLMSLGIGSGLVSVLVFLLYTGSEKVQQYFASPLILVGMVPILFYWIGRMWILAQRGLINIDPVSFTIKDKNSYIILFLLIMIFILSSIDFNYLIR